MVTTDFIMVTLVIALPLHFTTMYYTTRKENLKVSLITSAAPVLT